MLNKLFLILNFHLLAVYALPMDHSTNSNGSWPESVKRATPILQIDYLTYPQSAENICYSWHCNNGPRFVAPHRNAASHNRRSNSCGRSSPNRCSTRNGHIAGYQCDEWPWANSHAGGANVVTRCIPSADNGGSGSVWGNFINNKGPQAPGYRLNDLVDSAEIRVVRIPNNAYFCMGELGYQITNAMCAQGDHGQPYLQRVG